MTRTIINVTTIKAIIFLLMLSMSNAQARDIYQGVLETVFTKDGHYLSLHLCRAVSADFKLVIDPNDANSAKALNTLTALRHKKNTPITISISGDVTHKGEASNENDELTVLNYEVGGFKYCTLSSFFDDLDVITAREMQYKTFAEMIQEGHYQQANQDLKYRLKTFHHDYGTKDPQVTLDANKQGESENDSNAIDAIQKAQAQRRLLALRQDIEAHKARLRIVKRWQHLTYRASNNIVKGKYQLANAQLNLALKQIGTAYLPHKDSSYPENYTDNTPKALAHAQQEEESGKLRASAITRLDVFKARFELLQRK